MVFRRGHLQIGFSWGPARRNTRWVTFNEHLGFPRLKLLKLSDNVVSSGEV